MTVQDVVRPLTVPAPRQAEPADAPLALVPPAAPPAAVPEAQAPRLLGKDRPLTADERQFVLGAALTFSVLSVIIVTFLLLSVHVWG